MPLNASHAERRGDERVTSTSKFWKFEFGNNSVLRVVPSSVPTAVLWTEDGRWKVCI